MSKRRLCAIGGANLDRRVRLLDGCDDDIQICNIRF